jgi:hypothetical protein
MLSRIFLSLCSIALLYSLAYGQSSDQRLVIPAGTVIQLSLRDPLSSKLSEVGDEVEATLRRNLVIGGSQVLPEGTLFKGRVTLIQPAKRTLKGGQLQVTFDRVQINGQERRLYSIVDSASNFRRDQKFEGDSEGTLKSGKNGNEVLGNITRGATIGMIGATIAILSSVDRGRISATGGAVGAAMIGGGVAAGVLLSKGQEIRLDPDTMLRLKLERELAVD